MKLWVNVETKRMRQLGQTSTFTVVYGTVRDAEVYAFDRMCSPYQTNYVTICDENFEIVKEYEV